MNAYHSPIHIEEGTAGISGTDRAIGPQGSILQAYNSPESHDQRTFRIESARVPHRQYPIPAVCLLQIPNCGMRPGALIRDPDQSSVVFPSDPNGFSFRRLAIGKSETHFPAGSAANMARRQNKTILRDHHPAAAAAADLHI